MAQDYEIRKIKLPEDYKMLFRFEEKLRSEDRRELSAVSKTPIKEIFESIWRADESWIVTGKQKEPLVIFGRKFMSAYDACLIWCLATTDIKAYWKEFAIVSRDIVRSWANEYGLLFNEVGAFNKAAIRWLKWCGAEFSEEKFKRGEAFLPFTIIGGREKCVQE